MIHWNAFFQKNYLTCHKGWMLFKDKDYLLQAVPFFVVKEIPYVYEQGCCHADPSGIRLKAHIHTKTDV